MHECALECAIEQYYQWHFGVNTTNNMQEMVCIGNRGS